MSWGLANLRDGDEILFSPLGHASNVYPWVHLRQLLARFGTNIALVPYGVTATGAADPADIAAKVSSRTRLIVATHIHNLFGSMTTLAELRGRLDPSIRLCFDCSQSVGHVPVDVTRLGADFAAFSGHKMFGVPGTGVLYASRRVHHELVPFLPGGGSGVRLAGGALREVTGFPFPSSRTIVLICPVGEHSGRLAASLAQAGHDTASLAGGVVAWRDAGLPLESGLGPETAHPP